MALWRRRLVWAIAMLAPIVAPHLLAWWRVDVFQGVWLTWVQLAAAPAAVYVGWPFYVGALRRAVHFSTNMDTLVAIGTLAAYGAGVYGLLTPRRRHAGTRRSLHELDGRRH